MRQPTPSLPPGQPDPVLIGRVLLIQRVCLALAGFLELTVIAAWLIPELAKHLPIFVTHTSIPISLAALLCTFSLVISEPGNALPLPRLSRAVELLAALIAMCVLIEGVLHLSDHLDTLLDVSRTASSDSSLALQPAAAFVFMGVTMVFVHTGGSLLRHVADAFVSCLALLVLILLTENLFGALRLFGLSANELMSPVLLSCLVLLTATVVLRQSEFGVFSIFLGRGIGSRIARGFAPILLLLPFLSEVARSRSVVGDVIPDRYATAILTSIAAGFSLLLLLFLVWRINEMEQEIHDLTLRDELTGLYNMRGFYLLAEQTLRLAQRAQLPFSVLFIDLDGLKQINDRLGHNTGSAYLADTGELIAATFRETDVKGRFGGDEFVVAGQFSIVGIEIAANRLQVAAEEHNANTKRKFPLSFSIGHVTTEPYSQETLKELVTRADAAMYKEKRRKKVERK
jgi:diguanylate cyclase (GGDEF)-like protein